MKAIFTILSFLCPLVLSAQVSGNTVLDLSAVVRNASDQPVAFVTVTNLTHHTGVVSNEDGYFNIRFDKSDTLEISAVGYEKHKLYFGDTTTTESYDLIIRLSEKTYELENVTVFAYKDERSFKKAILALDESDLPKTPPKIEIPGSYDGPKIENRPGLVRNPVSFLYDRLSGKARDERKAYQVAQEYQYRKTLAKKYNKDLVGEITGLKEDKLNEFMVYCRLKDTFVENANDYEIIVAINRCYEDFKVNRH